MRKTSVAEWAESEFAHAQLGDARRTRRLVAMAEGAATQPKGKVSAVFDRAKDREGAYDFLESEHVEASRVADAMFKATAERVKANTVFVPLDISSLTLTDDAETKDFGVLGASNCPVRGVLVVNALAVSPTGVPLGLIDQQFWTRDERRGGTVAEKVKRNLHRAFDDKQGAWIARSIDKAMQRLLQRDVVPWFVIDREADSRHILERIRDLPCLFTIRGTKNRSLVSSEKDRSVRAALQRGKPIATAIVSVRRTGRRPAREAQVEVRTKEVELRFRKLGIFPASSMKVHAVWVRELVRVPGKDEQLDWMLYTNAPVESAEAALQIVESYRARWRVEEFHRTWKQGKCDVETTQLRSLDAVMKWATVLSAVAVRIERLKYFSREEPDAPASVEFSDIEVEAIKLARSTRGAANTKLPEMPSVEQITHWIAELGGWIGPRNGPPGSITLARGLERLAVYVDALCALKPKSEKRRRK